MKELYDLQHCSQCQIYWRENSEIFTCPTCAAIEQYEAIYIEVQQLREEKETLFDKIKKWVERGDLYDKNNPALGHIQEDLREVMEAHEPYSKAAKGYIRCFRDREWVDELFV